MPRYREENLRKATESLPACERIDKLETRENNYLPGQSKERWTEYCSELYTHTTGDPKQLDVPPPTNNDSYSILREEVEAAVKSPKKGKSAGVENIPSEPVKAGGE